MNKSNQDRSWVAYFAHSFITTRSISTSLSIFLSIALSVVLTGCPAEKSNNANRTPDPESNSAFPSPTADQPQPNIGGNQLTPGSSRFLLDQNGKEQIAIGTFNIQSLGRKKVSKPEVTSILVDIIRRFDVIAIQELRDVDQKTIPQLMSLINKDQTNFQAIVGPRQGYQVNTGRVYHEQAVYIYDTRTIKPIGQPYVANDTGRIMHRAPFVSQFQTLPSGPYRPFSFTLLNVHVDPDEVSIELPAMSSITRGTFANHDEDDFIVLGDLNATPKLIALNAWLENQISLIPKTVRTNTAMTRTIDNIVLDRVRTAEFSQVAGVINLQNEYSLTRDKADAVSDHMPAWGIFSAYESDPARAVAPPVPGNGAVERTTRLPGQTDRLPNETAR